MSSPSLPIPDSNLGAEKPFDASTKADIILRSIDSVDFFVLKTILSLASPVFDDIFSSAREGAETKNGLTILDLAEDSDTLYNLLLLVYPYAKEPTDTLDMYMKVGIAAQKYAMDEALQRLRKMVGRSEAIVKEPLGTFALAVHFGWADVIKGAAWNTLAVPLCDFKGGDELRMVTGADFVDLLQWRFACGQAIDSINERLPAKPGSSKNLPTTPRPPASGRGMLKMIEKLRERLKDTGCPQSAVVIDESVIAQGLGSITSPTLRNRSPERSWTPRRPNKSPETWNPENETMSEYREVLENAKSLAKEIDDRIAKVPFKIRDRWIVAPLMPPPSPILESPVYYEAFISE